jgi:hypothetical protein
MCHFCPNYSRVFGNRVDYSASCNPVFVACVDPDEKPFQEAADRPIAEANVIPLVLCTLGWIWERTKDSALLTILAVPAEPIKTYFHAGWQIRNIVWSFHKKTVIRRTTLKAAAPQ